MNRTSRFLQLAREQALLSSMKPQVGAVLTRGSKVIKLGYNKEGKPRFVGSWTRHAEVVATINTNAEDAVVYVYRQHGLLLSPLLSKPCTHCMEWLGYIGVTETIYSIPEYPYFESITL